MKEFVEIAIPSISASRNRTNPFNSGDLSATRRLLSSAQIMDDGAVPESNCPKSKFVVLGIDLTSVPDVAKFAICCSGVLFFYLIYGYMQVCKTLRFLCVSLMCTWYSNVRVSIFFAKPNFSIVLSYQSGHSNSMTVVETP